MHAKVRFYLFAKDQIDSSIFFFAKNHKSHELRTKPAFALGFISLLWLLSPYNRVLPKELHNLFYFIFKCTLEPLIYGHTPFRARKSVTKPFGSIVFNVLCEWSPLIYN